MLDQVFRDEGYCIKLYLLSRHIQETKEIKCLPFLCGRHRSALHRSWEPRVASCWPQDARAATLRVWETAARVAAEKTRNYYLPKSAD